MRWWTFSYTGSRKRVTNEVAAKHPMDHAPKRARSAPLESRSQSPDALATLPHVAAATPFLGPRCRGVVPCGSSQAMRSPRNPVRFSLRRYETAWMMLHKLRRAM